MGNFTLIYLYFENRRGDLYVQVQTPPIDLISSFVALCNFSIKLFSLETFAICRAIYIYCLYPVVHSIICNIVHCNIYNTFYFRGRKLDRKYNHSQDENEIQL